MELPPFLGALAIPQMSWELAETFMGFLLNPAEVHQKFVKANQKVLQNVSASLNFSNKKKKGGFFFFEKFQREFQEQIKAQVLKGFSVMCNLLS